MTVRRLLLFIFSIAVASVAYTQGADDSQLLDVIVRSNQNLRCKGIRVVTFRYVRDGKQTERKLREVVVIDGNRNRTEYTGDSAVAGQIAVDDGKSRYHFLPNLNVINKSPSLQNQNAERLEMLVGERRKDYSVSVTEGAKVATYDTYLVTLKSTRGFVHRLWVEKRRKAILKREFQGPDSEIGTSYEFESFEYRRRIDPDEFNIVKPGATVLEPTDRLALAAKKLDYASYVVRGDPRFELYEAGTFEAGSEKVKVLRSIYGDGKIVVTLHQFKGATDPTRFKGRAGGRTNSHFWKQDGYNFVLVGDIPTPELERLAKLVRR